MKTAFVLATAAALVSAQNATQNATGSDAAATAQCQGAFVQAFTTTYTTATAKACEKDSGVSQNGDGFPSDAEIKKFLNTTSCQKYWDEVVVAVKAIKPPCQLLGAKGNIISTASFDWTFKEVIELAVSMQTGDASSNSSTPKPAANTTKPAGNTTNANSTTAPKSNSTTANSTNATAAPTTTKPSSAAITGLSLAATAAVAAMYA